MFMQSKIVKTVHKWHASTINLKRNVYQRAIHIIFKVRIFSTIGFRQFYRFQLSTDKTKIGPMPIIGQSLNFTQGFFRVNAP
jgi:hypothetical protein